MPPPMEFFTQLKHIRTALLAMVELISQQIFVIDINSTAIASGRCVWLFEMVVLVTVNALRR